MRIKIFQSGRRASAFLPARVLRAAKFREGRTVELTVGKGVVKIRSDGRRQRTLCDVIAQTPCFERLPGWTDHDVGLERETFLPISDVMQQPTD